MRTMSVCEKKKPKQQNEKHPLKSNLGERLRKKYSAIVHIEEDTFLY